MDNKLYAVSGEQMIAIERLKKALEQYKDMIPWDEVEKKLGIQASIHQLFGFLQSKGIPISYDQIRNLIEANRNEIESGIVSWGKKLFPAFLKRWQLGGWKNRLIAVGYLALYGLTIVGLVALYYFLES